MDEDRHHRPGTDLVSGRREPMTSVHRCSQSARPDAAAPTGQCPSPIALQQRLNTVTLNTTLLQFTDVSNQIQTEQTHTSLF